MPNFLLSPIFVRPVVAKMKTVNAIVGVSATSCIFVTPLPSSSGSYDTDRELKGNCTHHSNKVVVVGNQASATGVPVHHLVVAGMVRIDGREKGIELH
jgi:hypothetical protein